MRLGIIAGSGHFPMELAKEAKRQGLFVVVLGLQGWADTQLSQQGDVYEEIAIGQLALLIERLKVHHVRQAVMAGKVTKEVLFQAASYFDAEMLKLIALARNTSVWTLLGLLAERLRQEDVEFLDASEFLRSQLCPLGVLTTRGPTDKETADIEVGLPVARSLASFDVGQTVVVKERVVVALEALEGTDATIERAASLAGKGLVVVKTASPNQDRRFDLPIIGRSTVELMRQVGVSCLAVEAGSSLLLEREEMILLANASNLCIVGISIDG